MEPPEPMLADAFKLSVDGDRVIIEVGQGVGTTASGQPHVRVTDHVVIPRALVHRLMLQLDEALRPHAAALRLAEAQAMPPGQAAVAARPGAAPARPAADESGAKAAQLIGLVGELGMPHQYERSFRLSRGSLQGNRFLLSFNTRDVPGDARERVLDICTRMAMPPAARQAASEAFGMAHCLHLGFEGDAAAIICKLYLERSIPAEEARAARAEGRPVLLHLAFKWDIHKGQAVTTRYHWLPGLSAERIAERLEGVYAGVDTPSRGIALDVLRLAASRVPAERMQYLEVDEVENDRRSFDLNLYNAKMAVRDIQPSLFRMRDHFGVRPGQFQAVYDQIQALSLGHLAGGVHRNGADFFNLYYGVASLPRFSDRFAPGD